jgi:CRISPR/Cas system-associated exonuclease Cas4 (RecB family)
MNYTEEEINDAVEKFKQAVAWIKSCEFEPNHKDNACDYCSYKDFCNMNRI